MSTIAQIDLFGEWGRCFGCGSPLPASNKRRMLCGDRKCRNVRVKWRYHDTKKRARPERPCVLCAKPLPAGTKLNRKYCSYACTKIAGRVRQYGGKNEDYQKLLARQDNCCAGCREPFQEGDRRHLDHDHTSGLIRGILHHGCNTALGLTGESPARLRALAHYLEGFEVAQ